MSLEADAFSVDLQRPAPHNDSRRLNLMLQEAQPGVAN